MKNYQWLFLLFLAPLPAFSGPCATTGGAVVSTGGSSVLNQCSTTPQGYYLTIYKLGICTSNPSPVGRTAAPDLSSCHLLLNDAAGQYTQLAAGQSVALPGATMPSYGTYGYAVLVVSNEIGIKNTQTYSTTMYGSGGGSGTTCWTKAGTVANQASFPTLVACGLASAAAPAVTIT